MSKRYQPLKEFGHAKKKTKLDVSINKGRPAASTSKAAHDIHLPPTQKEPFKPTADLWDDDEDDVILLATQVAESEIAASEAKKDQQPMEITESEITFSDFEPKVQQHSTQAPQSELFSQLFDDDDEDIAHLAEAIERDAERQKAHSKQLFQKRAEDALFKKPALPQKTLEKDSIFDDEPGPSTKRGSMPLSKPPATAEKQSSFAQDFYAERDLFDDEPGPSTRVTKPVSRIADTIATAGMQSSEVKGTYLKTSIPDDELRPSSSRVTTALPQTVDTSAEARKQLASERQIKFLMERLDALKQENTKLSKDLTEVKETMQTKTGEASMLRDELRHTKQKLDELKMEKMFQTESVNAESRNKIEELSRKVHDKESELQLKSMECSMLKMRQADETRRVDTTTRDTTIPPTENPYGLNPFLENMPRAEYKILIKVESTSLMLMDEAFECNEEKGNVRKWSTLVQRELDNLQRIQSKVLLNADGISYEFAEQVTESVCKVFSEFSAYVDGLEFGFHQTVLPQHDYDILEDETQRPRGCLHFTDELCKGERGINMRRYIALVAVLCEQSSKMVYMLLEKIYEDKPLLQKAINAIIKLGFSYDVCAHFGILEAFALLLRTLLLHLKADDDGESPHLELLFNLLKYLVFARPNPWTLYELSYSVIDMCDRFNVFPLFCINSKRDTFMIDRAKSVYRFSNDSCFLQVYCGLLDAAFPLYTPLKEPIFELQAKICLNHVRYVFYSVTDPPDFINKILSADDEDDESDDEYDESFSKIQSDTEKEPQNLEENSNRQANTEKQSYETFENEQPTTSRNAALREEQSRNAKNVTASSTKDDGDNTATEAVNSDAQCHCFEELCLSAVRMVWLSLRQWQRFYKLIELKRVGMISRVAVHLLYFLFCDNYLACLFREDEVSTKDFIYLICHWWLENEKELKFSELQLGLLHKLKNSHVIPKIFLEEEPKPENIAADLAQWCRLTNETFDPTMIDTEKAIKNLRLREDMFDPDIFLELQKKPSLDLESFDFNGFSDD